MRNRKVKNIIIAAALCILLAVPIFVLGKEVKNYELTEEGIIKPEFAKKIDPITKTIFRLQVAGMIWLEGYSH